MRSLSLPLKKIKKYHNRGDHNLCVYGYFMFLSATWSFVVSMFRVAAVVRADYACVRAHSTTRDRR